MFTSELPSHAQMEMPLLEILQEHGAVSPSRAADLVAERLAVSPEVRSLRRAMPTYSKAGVNLFERRCRWVRQSLTKAGLVAEGERAVWRLTEKGEKFCADAQPGVLMTVFETDNGTAVWAEFQTGLGLLEDGTVQAMISSPPYPIIKGRKYGTFTPEQCINLIEEMFRGIKPKLRSDGSCILNLADVWEQGRPTRSLYQEELLLKLVKEHGFFLADRFTWINPSKPACTDWVTKRRERVRSSTETFYWLSPSPHPKADNRRVLIPYGETMKRTLTRGGDARAPRPSGHGHTGASYTTDNGGAIPPNFFNAPNSVSNSAYHRYCREMRLPLHPARFPGCGVLDFFVNLTTDVGDLVVDPCGGSQQIAEACERLGRRWVSIDKNLDYIRGGESYFKQAVSFQSFGIPGEIRPVLPLP